MKKRIIIESPVFTRPDGTRCSPGEVERNMRYLKRAALESRRRGESHSGAILTEYNVRAIRLLHSKGLKKVDVARRLGVSRGAVYQVISGKSWRHVQ